MRHQATIDFGTRLRLKRVEHRLKQAELAQLAGIARETVGRIERGVSLAHPSTLRALERALKLPTGTFAPEPMPVKS